MKSSMLTAVLASAALACAPSSVVASFAVQESFPISAAVGHLFVLGRARGSDGPGDDPDDNGCDSTAASDCVSNLPCRKDQEDGLVSCECMGHAMVCHNEFQCLDSDLINVCRERFSTCGDVCEGNVVPFPRQKASYDVCDIAAASRCMNAIESQCDLWNVDNEPTCECVEMAMNCNGYYGCLDSNITRSCREHYPSCSAQECSGTTGESASCDSDAFNACLATECVRNFKDGDCDCITTTYACLEKTGCEHDKSANDCAKASPECADQCSEALATSAAAEAIVSAMSVGLAVLAIVLYI